MKRSIKKLLCVLAIATTSAIAVLASGCSLTEEVERMIDQTFCEHEYNDGELTKNATCTTAGEFTRTCLLCGKTDVESTEKAEHVSVQVDTVEPTCTTDGMTAHTKCDVCGVVLVTGQKLPATGHKVIEVKGTKATCLENGTTDGKYCEVCGEVLVEQKTILAKGHNVVVVEGVLPTCATAGCTVEQYCDNCDEVFVEKRELPANPSLHVFNEKGICRVCNEYDFSLYSDSTNYTEVDVSIGEKVVGNVYRLYFQENESMPTILEVSCDTTPVSGFTSPSSSTGLIALNGDGAFLVDPSSGGVGEIVYTNVTNQYVDFYVAGGSCSISFKDGETFRSYYCELDGSSVVTSISDSTSIKRLVLNKS